MTDDEMKNKALQIVLFDEELSEAIRHRANDDIEHFEQQMGPIQDQKVRDELLCQYQVVQWKKLIASMGA